MFNPKRYVRDFLGATALYVASVFGSVHILNSFEPVGVFKVLVALLPIVPAMIMALVFLHHFRKLDEMQMRIQGEAFLIAALVTGLVTFSLGFAENAGLARLSLGWVLPGMLGLWGVCVVIINRRYR